MVNSELNYLMHHGVKGQKWGVRRYQNKDGSLTPAGKKHVNGEGDTIKKANQTLNKNLKDRYKSGQISKNEYKEIRKALDKVEPLDKQTAKENGERYGLTNKQTRALKVGAGIAAGVVLAYGTHKLINNPEVIAAGRSMMEQTVERANSAKNNLKKSVEGTTEYKAAKYLSENAAKIKETAGNTAIGKAVKKVGSDEFGRTVSGIGAMAGTAQLLKKQKNEYNDRTYGEDSTRFDRTTDTVKRASDIASNVNRFAKGPTNQKNDNGNNNNGKGGGSNVSVYTDKGGKQVRATKKLTQDEKQEKSRLMREEGLSHEEALKRMGLLAHGDIKMDDVLMHYGVPGMKWGVRRQPRNSDKYGYKSNSLRARSARRANDKVDAGFQNWNENSKKRANAIELGKQATLSERNYRANKSDKALKLAYKADKKAYKKALRENTTYRKGQIKKEVGQDKARKYMSDAKKVKKQLDTDPNNKQLQKQYNKLMSQHDIERAKARRAPEVAANRSQMKANMKRRATVAAKTAATSALIGAGTYAANQYLNKHDVTRNGEPFRVSGDLFKKANDYYNQYKRIKKYV